MVFTDSRTHSRTDRPEYIMLPALTNGAVFAGLLICLSNNTWLTTFPCSLELSSLCYRTRPSTM